MAVKKSNKAVKTFINEITKECKSYNVNVRLLNSSYVAYADNVNCGGYFEAEPELEIKVALKQNDWLPIFVHETCHFDQWKEKDPVWQNNESCYYMDKWLQGGRVKNINKHIDAVQELELNCEIRAYNKIINYNLPINPEEYIQKANVYVYMHTFVKDTRKWLGIIPPYKNELIWSQAPKKFVKDYSKIPNNLLDLLLDNDINI